MQPLLILANNYSEARRWAVAHDRPGREDPTGRAEGRSWIYARDWQRIRGRMGPGQFVDIRHWSPQHRPASDLTGGVSWLLSRGFEEVQA